MIEGIGVSYSPAGLLTPFHLGASFQLNNLGFLNPTTHFAGTSGGALAAITNRLQYDNTKILDKCRYIAEECLYNGTRGTLRTALENVLKEVISEESHDIANNILGSCSIAYKQIFPTFESQVVSKFHDKDDLINVLLASCNIPFYFNGCNPLINVRNSFGIDGFFAIERERFGCPVTNARNCEILITPFDGTKLIKPYDESSKLRPYDIISSHLLSKKDLPYDFIDLINLALNPPKYPEGYNADFDLQNKIIVNRNYIKSSYDHLFECGSKSVNIWTKSDGYNQILKAIEKEGKENNHYAN